MSKDAAVHVIVYGRVQGVYFRGFTARRATELGLTGYARNLADGTVEVYAEGRMECLQTLLSHLRAGPPAARVDNIITRWSKYTGSHKSFRISH